MNALAFTGTNFLFKKFANHGDNQRKRHCKSSEGQNDWNEDRMKRIDFWSGKMRQNNNAKTCISNAVEAALDYYQVFAKRIKLLRPETQL